MVEGVRRGDVVITGGGIHGKVTKVLDEENCQVEIAENVRIKVVKSTLQTVLSKTEPAADAKSDKDSAVGGKPALNASGEKKSLFSFLGKK